LEGLGMENVGIICGHLDYSVHFMAVWHSLCSFGIFFPFWYAWTWQPCRLYNQVFVAQLIDHNFFESRCHIVSLFS
jgi:hypothetical protein